jgi:hypothetical protein
VVLVYPKRARSSLAKVKQLQIDPKRPFIFGSRRLYSVKKLKNSLTGMGSKVAGSEATFRIDLT